MTGANAKAGHVQSHLSTFPLILSLSRDDMKDDIAKSARFDRLTTNG